MVLAAGGPQAQVGQQAPVLQTPAKHQKVTKVTIKEGENLSKIAGKYKTTWRRLFDANKSIKDPDVVNPGERIRIPDKKEKLKHRLLPEEKATPLTDPTQADYSKPTASSPVQHFSAPASGGVWDRLAACESGGNWAINTGNGYYGGLQFSASTWISNGGGAYAPLPNLATREQQIAIGSKLQAARGWSPWPACAASLGLL
jgi:hypothetical protein